MQVGAGDDPELSARDIRLVRVGRAELTNPAALAGLQLDTPTRSGRDGPAVLVAGDVWGAAALPALQTQYRTYAWVAPVAGSDIPPWEVDSLLRSESSLHAELRRRSLSYRLTGPDRALSVARERGDVAGERVLLLAGATAALLAGFALLAAMGLRRDLGEERRRLEQRGARRHQLWIELVTETGAMWLAGVVLGAVTGICAAAWLAREADLRLADLLVRGVGTSQGLVLIVGAALLALVLVAAGARSRETFDGGNRRAWDVAALAAAGAIALVLARGEAGEGELAAGSAGSALLLVPALAALVAAIVTARLLGPLMQLAERVARRGPGALRLALLGLARGRARTSITAAFLVASLGLALFASDYRATLEAGARDQAAYQVPLDLTVRAGPGIIDPLVAAPRERYLALAPGVAAYPVIRRTASVPAEGSGFVSVDVVGVAPAVLERMERWRSSDRSGSAGALARTIGADGPARLRGLALPPEADRVTLAARGSGAQVRVALIVAGADGRGVALAARRSGPGELTATVPPGLRGGLLVGVRVALDYEAAVDVFHRGAEGTNEGARTGELRLGDPAARLPSGASQPLGDISDWTSAGEVEADGDGLRWQFAFPGGDPAILRPVQPTDGRELRVLASPGVAAGASGGRITLEVGSIPIAARVVGQIRRMPGATPDQGVVVADESRLAVALEAARPGSGGVDELWLSVPERSEASVLARLGEPPFGVLAAESRRELEASLRDDPLARAISLTLAAAAALALVLAAIGLWLAVASELRDGRGELFDLEAQGVEPAVLRAQARVRAALLLAVGIAGGVALGLALALVVVDLVGVGATGATPVPPLRAAGGAAIAFAGLAAVAVLAAVFVEVTVRREFSGPVPRPAAGSTE